MEKRVSKCPNCGVELRFDRSSERKIKCPKCNYIAMSSTFPEVVKRKYICPACGNGVFLADGGKAMVKCPHCQQLNSRDKFFPAQEAIPDYQPRQVPPGQSPAQQPYTPKPFGTPEEDGSTIDPRTTCNTRMIDVSMFRPGVLSVVNDGGYWRGARTPISLKMGPNRIGRASQSIKVELSLPTEDPQMSRCHAMIEMVKKPDGRILHYLTDAGSKNGTYCGKVRLAPGDKVVLTKGDVIRLGNTELLFDMM